MILIALGANLPSFGRIPPAETLAAALQLLAAAEIAVLRRSRLYQSFPVPPSDQSLFVNAVAELATALSVEELLGRLHAIEACFGRGRRVRNEARVLDLDLLDYHGLITPEAARVRLPHPCLHARAFVLKPLAELVPDWRHPVLGTVAVDMLDRLPLQARNGTWEMGPVST